MNRCDGVYGECREMIVLRQMRPARGDAIREQAGNIMFMMVDQKRMRTLQVATVASGQWRGTRSQAFLFGEASR